MRNLSLYGCLGKIGREVKCNSEEIIFAFGKSQKDYEAKGQKKPQR